MENFLNKKVGIVHDWLTGIRGGERVLEVICNIFPYSTIYTLIYHPDAITASIKSHKIKTSILQSLPYVHLYYRYLLPIYPIAVRSLYPDEEIILSLSHSVAKNIHKPINSIHICYCFTPMRYAWIFYKEYFGVTLFKSILVKPILWYLRKYDLAGSKNVDLFIAISKHIAERIKKCYNRSSVIIYPPVDTQKWTANLSGKFKEHSYDLIVSALVPYKRIDLGIKAYNRYGWNLKIVGDGPEMKKLKKIANRNNIEFLGRVSDDKLLELYRNCRFLIFPGEEDFGLVPLEAMACGVPVIAFKKGGVTETVEEGNTGIFFDEQTEESLITAVEQAKSIEWDRKHIRERAEKFSIPRFIEEIKAVIKKTVKN